MNKLSDLVDLVEGMKDDGFQVRYLLINDLLTLIVSNGNIIEVEERNDDIGFNVKVFTPRYQLKYETIWWDFGDVIDYIAGY